MPPAERMQAAHVGKFAECTVGLRRVPAYFAIVANRTAHLLGEFANCHLHTAADVDVAVAHLSAVASEVAEIDIFKAINRGVGHILAP